MRKTILLALLFPMTVVAQRWDAKHDLVGRVNFEPVYAVHTYMATKRIPPVWNTKRGYLAISASGVHFISRRTKSEEYFVAHSDVQDAAVISGNKIRIDTTRGPRFFTVPDDISPEIVAYIESRTTP